jgi:hypothetical protein
MWWEESGVVLKSGRDKTKKKKIKKESPLGVWRRQACELQASQRLREARCVMVKASGCVGASAPEIFFLKMEWVFFLKDDFCDVHDEL